MPLRSVLLLTAGCLLASSGCGWTKRKPYANDPLVRDQRPVPGTLPTQPTASSTPVEPYPSPRPVLPADPSYVRGVAPDVPSVPESPKVSRTTPIWEVLPTPRPEPNEPAPLPIEKLSSTEKDQDEE